MVMAMIMMSRRQVKGSGTKEEAEKKRKKFVRRAKRTNERAKQQRRPYKLVQRALLLLAAARGRAARILFVCDMSPSVRVALVVAFRRLTSLTSAVPP